jgi:hypothetical protein
MVDMPTPNLAHSFSNFPLSVSPPGYFSTSPTDHKATSSLPNSLSSSPNSYFIDNSSNANSGIHRMEEKELLEVKLLDLGLIICQMTFLITFLEDDDEQPNQQRISVDDEEYELMATSTQSDVPHTRFRTSAVSLSIS